MAEVRTVKLLIRGAQTEFRADQRVIVDRLGARKALRRGLGVAPRDPML